MSGVGVEPPFAIGQWVMRPSPRIELWSGERYRISDALELIRLGGHFAGGTVCLWRDGAGGRGALLSGDKSRSWRIGTG